MNLPGKCPVSTERHSEEKEQGEGAENKSESWGEGPSTNRILSPILFLLFRNTFSPPLSLPWGKAPEATVS